MLYKSEVTGKDYKTVEELEKAEHEVELLKTKTEEEKKAKQAELASLNETASGRLCGRFSCGARRYGCVQRGGRRRHASE